MSLLARSVALSGGTEGSGRSAASCSVAALRDRVQERISADRMALLLRESPQRAKSEVRSVCRSLFAEGLADRLSAEERESLVERLLDSVFGLGPLEAPLEDDSITEIMVNGTSSFFVERDGLLEQRPTPFSDDAQVRALIDRIIGPLGRRIDESSPMVNARLPQGHRVNAVIPPLALDGSVLTIRKFREKVLTLEEMVESGSVARDVARLLTWAVRLRKNIAVTGGTGSGKTTLLNALSCKIAPGERILTIEDSAELRFHEHPHVVRLEARPRNAEGVGEVTIRDLVTNALRMRPDRIVVGECRGAEALDMLQAMNTGHDGSLTTLHANSPAEAVTRLATMVRYAADLPIDVVEEQIASAIDLAAQTARAPDGSRYVKELVAFSFDEAERRCVATSLYERDHARKTERWLLPPSWLQDVAVMGVADESEVRAWSRACLPDAAL